MNDLEKSLNEVLKALDEKGKIKLENISDGYHTFKELYDHRIVLFIAFCKLYQDEYTTQHRIPVWKSKLHSDGTMFDGWFIMGINWKLGEQITYHLPMKYWEKTKFADELVNAPTWDGHTSADVVERILKI